METAASTRPGRRTSLVRPAAAVVSATPTGSAGAATPRRASSSSASSPSTACPRSSRVVVASASPPSWSSVTATAWSASATARPARCRPRSPRASRRRRRTSSASPASASPSRTPCRVRPPQASFCCVRLAAGTGVIAGGPVRAVLECAGIHDVLSKSLGSSNTINIVHATVAALKQLEEPRAVAARRGLPYEDVAPARFLRAEAESSRGRSEGRCLMAARLKVTQIKSKISEKQNQRDTLRSLGLQRIGDVTCSRGQLAEPRLRQHRCSPGQGRGD